MKIICALNRSGCRDNTCEKLCLKSELGDENTKLGKWVG